MRTETQDIAWLGVVVAVGEGLGYRALAVNSVCLPIWLRGREAGGARVR